MSCLISFERCQSSCEEHGTSEQYKTFLSMVGFEQPTPHHFPACPSNHSAIGEVDEKWLKLQQYLCTLQYYKNSVWCAKGYKENKSKIIAYLLFRDWYHLNTRWLTQKKTFIISCLSDWTICGFDSDRKPCLYPITWPFLSPITLSTELRSHNGTYILFRRLQYMLIQYRV